ncbi:MAG: hypothetical protein ACK55I_13700, partial [bacterium]
MTAPAHFLQLFHHFALPVLFVLAGLLVSRDLVGGGFSGLAGWTLARGRAVPEGGQLLQLVDVLALVHDDGHGRLVD